MGIGGSLLASSRGAATRADATHAGYESAADRKRIGKGQKGSLAVQTEAKIGR
ncbi:hypothetical protein SAMN05216551_102322 [Chitinasiproducens palmae]|uniref:Uncharacterized protein n=1 Tax=Chitinasiproducens palmae TaxID=1770053 RepID=A0A1H2PL18_9BURK|nr:hypothetical protein SAMN05216551_102322 [Chitinasiproducens palmae]